MLGEQERVQPSYPPYLPLLPLEKPVSNRLDYSSGSVGLDLEPPLAITYLVGLSAYHLASGGGRADHCAHAERGHLYDCTPRKPGGEERYIY